ncbi:MAG: Zn-dependent exopeptidase M28 [Bacteroidales bacterium]|nr:Zn-dependent exopeptidase M28 [Bacteroidales bacterium]
MKKHLFPVMAFLIILASCAKEETLEEIRESITLDLIQDINADSLESYVTWMQNMGTRFCLSDNRRKVAVDIRDKFRSFGYTTAYLDSFLLERNYRGIDYSLWQYNVIARLEGDRYPDSISVMGAHYDSILSGPESDPFTVAPGAHDNASGVAAALEVARVMKDNNFTPEGSIEFVAFAAEELGLYGSWDYAFKASDSRAKIKMMLNNDMIAYEPSANMSEWKVNILNYVNSLNLPTIANRLAAKYTVLDTYTDNTLNKYSDSYIFSMYGYPALFFFKDADDPNYHSLNDIVDYCNFIYCREIVIISTAMLVEKNIY